ncbi:hypothetical protein, partial [Shigella sonnei]|uniref:hypothetical protein n=1 Tax=Shigella sonnei TaxID=624 RepID=UPI001C0A6E9D
GQLIETEATGAPQKHHHTLKLSLSDLIAAISNYSFCDPQHKMLFVAYEGRRIYGKRLHSQNDVLSEEKKLTLINCSR